LKGEKRMNRIELQTEVMKKAMQDETFRKALMNDPKGTVSKEFGLSLPDNFTVKTLEEDATTVTLFVPPSSSELSEKDLDKVAGGDTCLLKIF
jgi:hypothetical protein